MKKLVLYIWAFVFILSSGGVLVDMHYCMGKIKGTSISSSFSSTDTHCASCGMSKKSTTGKSCCHDTKKLVKNQFDQKIVEKASFSVATIFVILPIQAFAATTFTDEVALINHSFTHGPPLQSALPIYLRNRTFLI